MVETFAQPDFTAQDAATYKANIDASIQVVAEIGAQFACRESNPVGMKMVVEAGVLRNGTPVAAYEVSGIGAPGGNPRIDRICINPADGTYQRRVGAEAAVPVPPTIPTGWVSLCQILYYVGQTFIANSDILDERSWLNPAISAETQAALNAKASLTGANFSGPISTSSIFSVTGAGSGIEVGSLDTVSPSYFDFHTGFNIDYCARILANGGNGGSGTASLTYQASINVFTGIINTSDLIASSVFSDVGSKNFSAENTSTAAVGTKFSSYDFSGRDTINTGKLTASIRCTPLDINYVSSFLSFFTRSSDAVSESARIYGGGRLVVGVNLADDGVNTIQSRGGVGLGGVAVADLPPSAPDGSVAYALNGRKMGEVIGSGTGVPVYRSAGFWRTFGNDMVVAA